MTDTTVVPTVHERHDIARELSRRWDAQQSGFIRHRHERFTTMARVVAGRVDGVPAPRILDLAGGTGSLAAAVLEDVPHATVVVADKDPVLLAIAADLAATDERLVIAELDLTDPGWRTHPAIASAPFDAVVSSTALHWLRPEALTRVYFELAGVVRPGGLVLNGDHFSYDALTEPAMRALADADDRAVQATTFDSGVDTWDAWWAAAESVPHYATAVDRRRDVWGTDLHTPPPKVTADFHLQAMRSAGFAETGTVWRYLDDHVLYGVRDSY